MRGAHRLIGTTRNRRNVNRVPRRQLPSERRLPLRQLPSERSFSASPLNVDLVRNDRVFLLLNHEKAHEPQADQKAICFLCFICLFVAETKIVTLTVTLSVFLSQNPAN